VKIKLKGMGVSSGVAIGHVRLYHVSTMDVGESVLLENAIELEIQRFEDAIRETRTQIEELGKRVRERGEDKALGEILTMHLLLLEDRMIVERSKELIRGQRYGAEYALSCVLKEAQARYADLPDLFKERFKDVEDICRRLMDNLRGIHTQSLEDLEEEAVIVAKDLSPSDTASMRRDKVLGFVTEAGGKTSHTAILARALEIPAVVGARGISGVASDNALMIIDGDAGFAIIDPTKDDLDQYHDKQDQLRIRQSRLLKSCQLPPITLDGHSVDLAANIEFPTEVETVNKYGANGVGLFRTEFLFLNSATLPGEEEQYESYKYIADRLHDKPVIIRTLDIGGDKFAHALNTPQEMNPFLGCRAIRFSLENRDLFRTQLRAILRASVHKNLQIMFPLISGYSELLRAIEQLDEIKEELRSHNIPFDEDIRVGTMIEVPSAVMVAGDLAKSSDFFSIGTNDLIQYSLAVDRGNEKIAHMYQPLHPAVLRMIAQVVDVGVENQIPVEVCGEMANDLCCVLVLMAMGVERLSMAPNAIPRVKELVRCIRLDLLREFGATLVKLSSVEDVKAYIAESLPEILPDSGTFFDDINESAIFASQP
jgi:phosphoenolpyruvate-protein phosphotransferase (PTS system enzyme I)